MSKKNIIIFFIILLNLTIFNSVYGSEDINIIKRSEWLASEIWRYKDSSIWIEDDDSSDSTQEYVETEKEKKQKEKNKAINEYLSSNYKEDNTLADVIYFEDGHELVWPIQKTNYVKSIVVHHTDTSNKQSTLEAIRSIYKYHTITNGWGDVGYNYMIGFNGEIYEGRAGGDYTVGAHAIRNNRSSVGIAVIGKYGSDKISDKQYAALKKLVLNLTEKYGIDLNDTHDYHRDCVGKNCKFYIESYKNSTLVGHRDVGNTSCPGDKLYEQIQTLKNELKLKTKGFTPIRNKVQSKKDATDAKLDKLSEHQLLKLLASLDYKLEKSDNQDLKSLRSKVFIKIREKYIKNTKIVTSGYDKNNKIDIKLSYPLEDYIKIVKGKTEYEIKVNSGMLLINDSIEKEKVTIKSDKGSYLEIDSWDRIPEWDKQKKYNDNKFRGYITLYIKNGKLVVVNSVLLSDYLKGLGEVSDTDNTEKIKTIIVSARTYARWYMTKARKYPGELYDGSDNPDEFQKYLGYGLEKRSPHINKIVDDTTDQIITYNNDIIKPWYFSQSDGKTMSYKDYCKDKKADCKNVNYPYLTSVFDPGSVGKNRLGHGVGVSGAGATFLASKGWTSEMIIRYFLKGVKIKSM
ncbi:hypothetical protein EOM39_04685 [Candidatus Gracilibacteria bacterium]|nr:hypothetical protein [Candidatus Gracilibacteria bacterium]